MAKFEIWSDRAGMWRAVLRGDDGGGLLRTGAYRSRDELVRVVDGVKSSAADAEIVEL